MINDLKTSQIVPFGFFMGYGGCNPPCRQLPLVLSRINSRALTWRYAVKVIARPADGFDFKDSCQSGKDARQRGRSVLAGVTPNHHFRGCACLITCTLLHPRVKTHLKIIPLQAPPLLALEI